MRPEPSSAAIRSADVSCAINSTSSRRAVTVRIAYIWIHTQAEPDFALHLEMLRAGRMD